MGGWTAIGKGFAAVGKGAAAAAVWSSTHPEVVGAVATITGQPGVATAIAAVTAAARHGAGTAPTPVGRGIEYALEQLAALEADLAGHPGTEPFAADVRRIAAALELPAPAA